MARFSWHGALLRGQYFWLAMLCALAMCVTGTAASAQDESGNSTTPASAFAAPVPLIPGESLTVLTPHLRYQRGFEGPLTRANVLDPARLAQMRPAVSVTFGAPGSQILITFLATNLGDQRGEWLLATGRGALNDFALARITSDGSSIVLDGADQEQVGETLRTYHGLTHRFALDPGETAQFALTFKGKHSSVLELGIRDPAEFMRSRHIAVAIMAGSSIGMLLLIMISMALYAVTGRRDFIWLGLAELAHAIFVIHVNGYTISYFLYDKGLWIYSIGSITPGLYTAAMTQFARSLLNTKHEFPQLNKMLLALIIAALFTVAAHIIISITGFEAIQGVFITLTRVVNTIGMLGLPIVAWMAIRRHGMIYVPLLIAWTITTINTAYGTVSSTDLFPGLPYDWHVFAPLGLISSIFMTLTLVLHLQSIYRSKQASERELIGSLQDRLELNEKAQRLRQDKDSALATVDDQYNLIHASGHDSQQVMLALNAIVQFTEKNDGANVPDALTDTLRASVRQLQDIIDTTMSGPISSGENSALVMLGRFELRDLFRQMEMIYRPLANRKGLTLELADPGALMLLTDRAICARILSNLLNNSVKFTEAGSIKMQVAEKGGKAVITLRDTGCGMDPALIERLTQPDAGRQRADENAEGTGSGLAASLSAIRQLGGEIAIESEPGEGTVVIVTVPALSSTPDCPVAQIADKARLIGLELVDMDSAQPMDADAKLPENALLVTFDPTAAMRARLAPLSPVALLKPLNPDMLDHMAIAAAFRDNRDEAMSRS